MSTANKLSYLNDTKSLLRTSLNKFGSSILSTDTFRSYDTKLNDIYNKLPKITQSGAGFTLSDVQNGLLDDFKMIGTDLYQNQLPSEYTAVEYLQSDNECYIDTGINADYKLSLKLKMACLNTTQKHMGALKNNNGSYIRHHLTFNPTNPKFIGVYAGETNILSFLKNFDNDIHEFNLDIYNKKISIDNDSAIAIAYNNFDVGINYYLFARNGSNIEINKGTYKIYYCKMYYEDNLVRDFVPCYRNSDNVAGLYDFVTNTFFTNQGTGTFTVGNTITLPNPDYPQEIKVVEGRQVITDKGKNLFTLDNQLLVLGNVRQSGNNQEFTLTGFGMHEAIIYKVGLIKDFVGKTLTFKCDYTTTSDLSNEQLGLIYCDNDGSNRNILSLFSKDNNTMTTTYTIPSSIDGNLTLAVRLYGTGSVNNSSTTYMNVQLEENSTATDYEPYYNPVSYNIDLNLENIYLAKMPNTTYKNRIYKNNGNWYFEKNIEKVVFDGSSDENWQRNETISGENRYYQFYINFSNLNINILDSTCYSKHFKFSRTVGNNFYINFNSSLFVFPHPYNANGDFETVTAWKNWLSQNNDEIYVPIETITTQITNTTLIDQLEAISVHTGTNIITISNSNNIIPEIEITRLKELEKLA